MQFAKTVIGFDEKNRETMNVDDHKAGERDERGDVLRF